LCNTAQKRGNLYLAMPNIRPNSVGSLRLNFHSPTDEFDAHFCAFLQTNLGKIYLAFPWKDWIRTFGLKQHKVGRKGRFGPHGMLALMILKHYSGLGDKKLIEHLNGNIHWQIFCHIQIRAGEPIRDFKVVSKIRCQLGKKLGSRVHRLQKDLARFWKPHMTQTNVALVDATCYESSVRYPTDQKLLRESVEWAYSELKSSCKFLSIRMPRTKYLKWAARYQSYSRKRKRRRKERRSLTRGLLRLLEKLVGELHRLEQTYPCEYSAKYISRRKVVEKVLGQQYAYFHQGIKPSGRIVSLAKPYLRPIVRGKEVKAVEFGAKVNKVQIDGINFIETLSFEAFNEGTRLHNSIFMSRRLLGRVDVIGADAIYATNKNRSYCTGQKISTDFRRKGRAGKYEAQRIQLAKNISKERASRLEGSFGTEKNHYLLHRIGARTEETERLWIFIGIHTANALKIGRRMAKKQQKEVA